MRREALRTTMDWRGLGCLLAIVLGGCAGVSETLDRDPRQGEAPEVLRHTLKELRDHHVIKQALDYSCGAAALATLMVYYFGDTTSEQEILGLLQAGLTPEELAVKAQRGFSLLDLKRVAQVKGYQAGGFKLTVEQLMQVAAPVMVFVEPMGYKHFAVLRGIEGGRVYLADPARGNVRKRIDQFVTEWEKGIVFVLGKPGEEHLRDYPLKPPRPFDDVPPELLGVIDLQDQGLPTQNLSLRGY